MRAKRENKKDAESAREFNVSRFLWPFATEYMKAKKEGTLEQFWEGSATQLASFDKENPGCRRNSPKLGEQGKPLAKTSNALTTPDPPSATIGEAISKTTHSEEPPLASKRPSIAQEPTTKASATLGKGSRTPHTTVKVSANLGHDQDPTGEPAQLTLTPISSVPPRTRSVSPIAGPSKPRRTSSGPSSVTSSTTSVSSTEETAYVSKMIKGPPSRRSEIEFQPSSESESDDAEELPSIRVMSKKQNGKGKAKARSKEVAPERKPPISTGEEREPPCKRCVRTRKTCYNQVKGKTCMNCATMKLRCEATVIRPIKKTTNAPKKHSPLPTTRTLRARDVKESSPVADNNRECP